MSATADAAAAGFPRWVMLEQFIFRRDDEEFFPDDTKASIRVSGTTSWGAWFRIAVSLAEPPRISRLYAQLPEPGFLPPEVSTPLAILGTHHHLILFRLGTEMYTALQDFFIYNAKAHPYSSSSLKALPPCIEPEFDYSRADGGLSLRHRRRSDASPRLLAVRSMGLWCGREGEFVVAELNLVSPMNRSKIFANICMFRGDDQLVDGTWNSILVEIPCDNDHDLWQRSRWITNAVVPFHQWLCWIDYNRGILFCDMSKVPTPTISFLNPPMLPSGITYVRPRDIFSDIPSGNCFAKLPTGNPFVGNYSFLYCSVSVVNSALKFVSVTRHDGLAFEALKPGAGFTVTCHTLVLGGADGSMAWEENYKVTSGDLWEANPPELLPHGILMFPQVDMDRPHAVVHFLFIEFGFVSKKMWVVSIDMNTKIVESFSPYVNGKEGLQTDDADLVRAKSKGPMSFLPCEFTKFLNLSRKRKDME